MPAKKARAKRVGTINLLAYELHESPDGSPVLQGVGRTLNVSQTGVLLETDNAIEEGQFITIEIGLEEELIKAKGEIVYCRKKTKGKFEHGIKFSKIEKKSFGILSDFVKQFRESKHEALGTFGTVSKALSNVVLTISAEHQVILKHLAVINKTVADPDPFVTPIQVNILFDLMYKDLAKHFKIEEKIIFEAALMSDLPKKINDLIEHLTKEHHQILEHLLNLQKNIKSFVDSKRAFDENILQKIKKLIQFIKHHTKLEIVSLFPEIDKNATCKKLIKKFVGRYGEG